MVKILSAASRRIAKTAVCVGLYFLCGIAGGATSDASHTGASALVDSLANHNLSPQIVGQNPQQPLFPDNYDWKEQDRVLDVVGDILNRTDSIWPELIDHLQDQRYSLTLNNDDAERVNNSSVGSLQVYSRN
jgi:hypothetical protein